MAKVPLTPQTLTLIAERFKVLGEPARLQLLNSLRADESQSGERVEAPAGASQPWFRGAREGGAVRPLSARRPNGIPAVRYHVRSSADGAQGAGAPARPRWITALDRVDAGGAPTFQRRPTR